MRLKQVASAIIWQHNEVAQVALSKTFNNVWGYKQVSK